MRSEATTPDAYIQSLPEDRQPIMQQLRQTLLASMPAGFQEVMSYGMLGYVVPLSLYPAGYHAKPGEPLPVVHLASQKNYISLYHMGLYEGPLLDWLKAEWPRHSKKKLDMGKCCLRFRKAQDVPLPLIAEMTARITLAQWIEIYEKNWIQK